MKNLKIVLFSLFVIGTVFTSCSSDDSNVVTNNEVVVDENEVEAEAVLEGKWIFAKNGAMLNEQEILIDYEHTAGCAKDFIEISTGGAYKTVNYFGTECTEEVDAGKWTKDGNVFTVTFGEGTSAEIVKGKILSLTASELKLTNTYTVDGESVNEVLLLTRAN